MDAEALEAVGAEISAESLIERVTDLTQLHRVDEKYDCFQWNVPVELRWCNLSRTARILDDLERQFQEAGLRTRREAEADDLFATENLIAEIPGATHPEEVVLIGAHFDTYWVGADDNSTGIAAMVELARALKTRTFDRTIRFVAFDLEEFGSVGSSRHAMAQKKRAGETLKLALIFDCLGFYSLEEGSQNTTVGLPSASRGDFLVLISDDASIPYADDVSALNDALGVTRLRTLFTPADGTVPLGEPLLRSDHTSFWLQGYPALFMTDTALYRNPNYHHSSDLVETLHPELYAKTVRLAASAIAYWAGGPK